MREARFLRVLGRTISLKKVNAFLIKKGFIALAFLGAKKSIRYLPSRLQDDQRSLAPSSMPGQHVLTGHSIYFHPGTPSNNIHQTEWATAVA
jgi:hypothetical protein